MEEVKYLSTLDEIKAFSDPYRLQILTTYRKFDRPATVKEIADKLQETPAKVHYHVKKLEKVGILKLVDTKEINGIIAKYYLPTAERFVIKHKDHDKELHKVILSEAQRVISNLYDNSKKMVLEEIIRTDTEQEDNMKKDMTEFITSSNLYLTKEDAKELAKHISKLSKKRKKNTEEETSKYHMFAVLFPVEDDDEVL